MVRSLNQAGVTAAYEYSSTACVNSSSLLFFTVLTFQILFHLHYHLRRHLRRMLSRDCTLHRQRQGLQTTRLQTTRVAPA